MTADTETMTKTYEGIVSHTDNDLAAQFYVSQDRRSVTEDDMLDKFVGKRVRITIEELEAE